MHVPGVVPSVMVKVALQAINHSLGEGVDPAQIQIFRSRSYAPELQRDPVITATMPELLVRGYLAVRRAEAEAFAAGDVELEQRHHLHRF